MLGFKSTTFSKIAFNHTQIHAQRNKRTILQYYARILDSGCFLEGSSNQQLVEQLKLLFKNEYVTLVASGHDALSLAIQALKLKATDEVIFPINAYPTAFPLALSGVQLVGVDVDENGQIDPVALKKKITPRTKAIVIVHMYGLVSNLNKIKEVIGKRKITLIEDCAQAFCSSFLDQYTGTFGDIACFSFYPTKNVGTLGDGGAILTRHQRYNTFFQKAKKYGESQRYLSDFLAGHSRLPELQAAALNIYISELPELIKKKTELYDYYCQQLRTAKLSRYIRPLLSHPQSEPLVHLFVIEAQARDQLQEFLLSKKIETNIHYPTPVHQVPAFAAFRFAKEKFPVAESLSKNILSLPFHQYLSHQEIKYIVASIKEFYDLHYLESPVQKLSSLSIFFPAYNDQDSISDLVAVAHSTAKKLTRDFEILAVNDGSQDNTQKVLERLQKNTHNSGLFSTKKTEAMVELSFLELHKVKKIGCSIPMVMRSTTLQN
jgi:dTDP-4-amino-4,6-dideoxygalactose transaminase